MGSLIKNPGGTIVTGGGYIAGKAHLVATGQARLTAPGVGLDAGCVPGDTVRLMMQGTMLIQIDLCHDLLERHVSVPAVDVSLVTLRTMMQGATSRTVTLLASCAQ